jgi:hypothetical protein
MTINDEQPRLSVALREAARSFDLPDFDALCEQAVRRGRRAVVRRRAVGAGIGVLALAGVAGGLAGTVSASHPARGLRTVPVVTVSNESLSEYMAKNFMALLPAGTTLVEGGVVPLTGEGLRMGPSNGDWEASASVFAMYQGKKTTFNLSVVRQGADRGCITQLSVSVYTCTSTTVAGHPLLTEQTSDGGVPVNWAYTWNLGGGKAVELSVDQKLSEALVTTVVTAPAWTSVLTVLPAYVDCPTLEQVQEKPAWVWRCPTTGKTYPVQSSDTYLYPSS